MKQRKQARPVRVRLLAPTELARISAGDDTNLKQHVDNPGQTPMKD